jgi:hypothetical protein
MNPIQANDAFNRVAGTSTSDESLSLKGTFRGALLESWRFDFITDEGQKISGKIDESLTPERLAALSREFYDLPCIAVVVKTTVLFKNGRVRTTHLLVNLEALNQGSDRHHQSNRPPSSARKTKRQQVPG